MPQYTRYVINNSATHNWYNDTDYGSTVPSFDVNTLSPNYAWSLTANGGGVADINASTGVLTLSDAPTSDITVRLTVSNISPLSNKNIDFTLTRAAIGENVSSATVITGPTIDPTSTALYYNEGSQVFTSTAEANNTTTTTPAHTTLTGGGNTYYYYNGTLYSSTEGFSTTTSSSTDVTLTWSLSGAAASYLTRTPATGTSTTVTHSSQSPSDLTATLTVTASATDASDKTATATITAYGAMVQPTITRSGNTISLSTTNIGATIYYTNDGSDPTSSSTRIAYSSPFDLTTSPTTVRAITERDTHQSSEASQTFQIKLPTPVITVSNTGLATIEPGEGTPAGTAIHYTTDGTTPTSSSTTYSAAVQLTNPQTIMAIAMKTDYIDSDVASADYIDTGVSGTKVVLDDREDHNWTYYSGVSTDVDGSSYNTSYNGTLYSPNPRNVKITYKANGGAVSIDESETEFIYYKTLEQGTTAGQYPYTVISNPFSKRPNGKGFGGWKIVSGYQYIRRANGNMATENAVLELDEQITFVGLPYPSVNCTSAEIEFTATWEDADVFYLSDWSPTSNSDVVYSGGSGTYETQILVIDRDYSGTITSSAPVTIMMVEPDGSSDYRNTYSFTGNITPNNSGVTKIEFTKWNSTNTLDCNNHSVTVGRGMTTTSQCASYVTGVTGKTTNNNLVTYNSNLNYHLKLESGKFTDVSFIAGTEGTAGYVNCNGTSNQVKGTLGNDYDRAKGDNTKLTVSDELFLGYRPTYANGNQNNANFTCWVKSGNLGSGIDVTNTTFNAQGKPNGGYYGDANQCFYVSSAGTQTNIGKRKLYVEGGILSGIAGGIDSNNPADAESFFLRMTGGTVRGVIYGSGAFAAASGQRRFVITGGTVKGWIAAGCNGTDPTQSGGTLPSNTYIYVGGDAHVGHETQDLTLNTSTDGNIFGAGSGNSAQATTGQVNNSNVVIADESYVKRNVYGGGNYGYSNATATLYVTGGEVAGSVFGGSNQKQGVTVNVNMTGGLVKSGVYGGSNVTGTISQNVTMKINGGQVGADADHPANIHGGGYGSATRVTQNVEVTLGKDCNSTTGVTVYGDVYGGSALGYVNGTAATNSYHTYVTLNKGTIHGSLYGGGLGDGSTAANVYGPVQVKVFGGSVQKTDANGANGSGGVYGANNVNGAPQRSVTVDIYGTDDAPAANEYALFAVYGGGNAADYTYGNGYPKVTVHNCNNSIEYVYGGGNAAAVAATDVKIYGGNVIGNVFGGGNGISGTAANVTGNTNVNIYGGTILKVFGGSNKTGTIGGSIYVNAEAQTESGSDPCTGTAYSRCAINVDELYGGGNMAASNVGNISIGCMNAGDMINYVYGGSNDADITGNINLTMSGGRVGNLFGGNNTGHSISGSITVNVNWDGSCSNNYLGNVYGGGNLATFGTTESPKAPTVNILNGTVSGNVYGGGKGDPDNHNLGKVTGNPLVTIGDSDGSHQVTISGSVFGGGDAGDVAGTPVVNVVEKCNTVITTGVYGGGNAADVTATDVRIYGGIIGDVFGGGNGQMAAANVTNTTSVAIHGGTITRVFAGSNTSGTIGGSTSVTVDHTSSCDQSIDEVYGGGNLAAGKAGTITIQCSAENIGDVYGGANQANIGTSETPSNIVLNINGGQINNVFGGNNTSGTIYGTITVNVNKATDCDNFSLNNVYGGGNLAQYTGSPAVNILNGTVSQNVYGGGKGDPDNHNLGKVTGNPVVTIGDAANLNNNTVQAVVTGDVYGGGDAGNVVGTPQVNVINKCNTSIANVYGGGNAADVSGTDVNIDGGNITGMVFGGGHGNKDATPDPVAANVGGNVAVDVTGGTINKVFGGSNSYGNITGTVAVNIDKGTNSCEMHITEVYGGGNEAAGNAGTITIGCTGTDSEGIVNVFGGANEANINSNITLNITGGKINNVFGGNNNSGAISGSITVNVNWNGSCTNNYLGNVFGGGNLAAYSGSPAVNILNGTVSQNVYGGGNGDPDDDTQAAGSTGAPTVTIGDLTSGHEGYVAKVLGDVYGGGNAAKVTGSTAPTVQVLNKCNTEIGYVYGGGNAADVPATNVTIAGGTIHHDVFGGGHGDNTPGSVKAANVTNNVSVSVTGAKIDRVFAGSNLNGSIGGTVALSINKSTTANCDMKIGEVYGGGNVAAGNAGTITIGCTGDWTTTGTNNHTNHNSTDNRIGYELEGIGTVYGGANQADINNDITLNIISGIVENVFGGNNTSGSIAGSITVNINKDNDASCASDWYVGNVYGAGNLAPYTIQDGKALAVNIKNGTVSQSVYGGGKGSTAIVTGNPVVTVGDAVADHCAIVTQNVYGGGDAAAVTGNTHVTYNDNNASSTVAKLFGGGNEAGVSGTAQVDLTLGTVTTGLYGGCNTSGTVDGNITVNVTGGTIGSSTSLAGPSYTTADVFGGGYGSATSTTGNVTVNINGSGVNIYGDVYGGSALGDVNDAASDKTTVNILNGTLHSEMETITGGFKVYHGGNVYGGGLGRKAVGEVGDEGYIPPIAAAVNGEVIVNIGFGTIADSNPYTSAVTGITGNATIGGNVYGCNNTNGSPQDNVTVNVFQTAHTEGNTVNDNGYAIANVFGGGNEANYDISGKTATVNIWGCNNTIERTFGGGNAAATRTVVTNIQGGHINQAFGGGNGERGVSYGANVNGDVYLNIHGGHIGQSFGGSNQNGTISGEINIVADDNGPCGSMIVDEFFCGGNFVDITGNVETTITCSQGMEVHDLYGGCNMANISGHVLLNVYGGIYTNVYGGSKGDLVSLGGNHITKAANIGGYVTLNLYGGTIETVYGGSNINGDIEGVITVNVLDVEGECPLYITNIYGGSNLTTYEPSSSTMTSPIVNVVHIKNGISGNVYGGSKGEEGVETNVHSNPLVNIGYDATAMNTYIPSSYVSGYSTLLASPRAIIAGSVYGGGDAAKVTGNTAIYLRNRAKVFGNVYGGGNMGEVTGDTKVIVNGANQ